MHKLYARDKFYIVQGKSKHETLSIEKELSNRCDSVFASFKADDNSLLRRIRECSQNSSCFYPDKIFYDEAIDRGIDITETVSKLPLFTKNRLYVPENTYIPLEKYTDEINVTHSKFQLGCFKTEKSRTLRVVDSSIDKECFFIIKKALEITTNEELIHHILTLSLNEISFYPAKFYLDEAQKRGLSIEELVSKLPLMTNGTLFTPPGVELWSNGKDYREF